MRKLLYILPLLSAWSFSLSLSAMEIEEESRESRLGKLKARLNYVQEFCHQNDCSRLLDSEFIQTLYKDYDTNPHLHDLVNQIQSGEIEVITRTCYIRALLHDWYCPVVDQMVFRGELPKDGSSANEIFTKFGANLAGEMNLEEISILSPSNKELWLKYFAPSKDRNRAYAQEACPLEKIENGYVFAHDLLRAHFLGWLAAEF